MDKIRNFVIISHVDHGKSTLADRFLELTNAVDKRVMREQYLDQMELEQEKGITIKLQPIRLKYGEYILNLIDTPGHVDFTYEVSRSMAAVEGAILLVDATKGIQAQTLANLRLAKEQGLKIIPAVNKIDVASADIEGAEKDIAALVSANKVFRISAKTGEGVRDLLQAVVTEIPAPKPGGKETKALIFDSRYDAFLGVVAYVRLKGGELKAGDKLRFIAQKTQAVAKEVGYVTPKETSSSLISDGEIGYVATGIKDAGVVRIGDTITLVSTSSATPLKGYALPKPVVFVSFYPQDTDDFDVLKDAVSKLHLNDPSFVSEPEAHEALGRGFRCGFLGVLHSEIIAERIQREFKVPLVISRPSVEFSVTDKKGKELSVKTAVDWPDPSVIESVKEPWAQVEVITPASYYSKALQLLEQIEGSQKDIVYLSEKTVQLIYEAPLREIIIDFYDKLKSVTQGMASMDYEIIDMRPGDLVKLEVLVAGEIQEAFSKVVPKTKAYQEGKALVAKLKEVLPAQQFSVPLQAVVGGKVLARETIRSRRRDVTASLYGGDVTRKNKLLEKQKKGKKELKAKGRVVIPPKVFLDVFRS